MRHTRLLLTAAALATLMGNAVSAACYADYKAKRDAPLRLHYGVAEVSACSPGPAEAELRARLDAEGWTLLNVLGVFDESGLAERKESAGRFYLRF